MADELRAKGLDVGALAHGFAERDRAVAAGFHLVRAKQVHGAELLAVDRSTPSPAGEADGLISADPGVAVAIATADCVPVLLAATTARRPVVAAVHAGWRGTLEAIVTRAVARVADAAGVRAADLRAALGPSIGGCCFEIEREIAARFADRFGASVWSAWRDGRPGKGTLDLREVNRRQLLDAGLHEEAIERVGPCTACGGGAFASYRKEGPRAGRQLSWIGIGGAG